MKQYDLLRHAVDVLEQMDVSYMIVGSYASSTLGEPRFTQDIDIVVKLMPEDIPALERAFPAPEYHCDAQMAANAIQSRGMFNIIQPGWGNKIDLIIARSDLYGHTQIARRQRIQIIPDLEAYVASPEDVILNKLLFHQEGGSDVHLRDSIGIMKVSGEKVDRDYVAHWAAQLGVAEIWRDVLAQVDG